MAKRKNPEAPKKMEGDIEIVPVQGNKKALFIGEDGKMKSELAHEDSIMLLQDNTVRGERLDRKGHIILGSWKKT